MTESEFQAQVIDVARYRGWMVMHQRPAQIRTGRWITAVQGDAGFHPNGDRRRNLHLVPL